MPELPEVETVARGLQKILPGRQILSVRLGKTDFIEDPAKVERLLPGSRVRGVRRYSKFLLIDLERPGTDTPNFSLFVHLGMTGQITICSPEARVPPHTHVFLTLDNGREFRYTDIRRFGEMRILMPEARQNLLANTGIDPLQASEDEFIDKLKNRRARIKALLLNQSVIGGMGNIYSDESLWRARVHPARLATNLKLEELRSVYCSVREVLREAIRFRGSSISDYCDVEGNRGSYQQKHRVYGRKGKKCFRCGTLIDRIIVAGRSSYYCASCQRAPRKPRKAQKGPRRPLRWKSGSQKYGRTPR